MSSRPWWQEAKTACGEGVAKGWATLGAESRLRGWCATCADPALHHWPACHLLLGASAPEERATGLPGQ